MSTITIKAFAEQIGIEPERLVKQLGDAGVAGKTVDDSLRDEENVNCSTIYVAALLQVAVHRARR